MRSIFNRILFLFVKPAAWTAQYVKYDTVPNADDRPEGLRANYSRLISGVAIFFAAFEAGKHHYGYLGQAGTEFGLALGLVLLGWLWLTRRFFLTYGWVKRWGNVLLVAIAVTSVTLFASLSMWKLADIVMGLIDAAALWLVFGINTLTTWYPAYHRQVEARLTD